MWVPIVYCCSQRYLQSEHVHLRAEGHGHSRGLDSLGAVRRALGGDELPVGGGLGVGDEREEGRGGGGNENLGHYGSKRVCAVKEMNRHKRHGEEMER